MKETPVYRVGLRDSVGWGEAVEVQRTFGRRHDPEPVQPLIRLTLVTGDDAAETTIVLALNEARALARVLTEVAE